jgi:hypothetical protein
MNLQAEKQTQSHLQFTAVARAVSRRELGRTNMVIYSAHAVLRVVSCDCVLARSPPISQQTSTVPSCDLRLVPALSGRCEGVSENATS